MNTRSVLAILLFASVAAAQDYAPIFPTGVVTSRELSKDACDCLCGLVAKDDKPRIVVSGQNPTCCLYILIHAPAPTTNYWSVIHQGGGTLIIANNDEQVIRAVKELKRHAKTEGDRLVYPIGVTSGE